MRQGPASLCSCRPACLASPALPSTFRESLPAPQSPFPETGTRGDPETARDVPHKIASLGPECFCLRPALLVRDKPVTVSVASLRRSRRGLAGPDPASWLPLAEPAAAGRSTAPTPVAGLASVELPGYFPPATW